MSSKNRKKILDSIRELGKADKYEIYSGKVSSVSEENATCDVDIDNDLTVFDVRLRSVVTDNKGVWVLPKVNSFVHIGQVDGGTDFILLGHSEVDKAFVVIGDNTIEINGDEITINNGANEGVPKVIPLTGKINAIEDKINAMLSLFNAWVPVPNDGGAALKTAFTALYPTTLAPITPITEVNDLKNDKLKH